jgi:hypothetical protein
MKASFVQICVLTMASVLAVVQAAAAADEEQKADDRWHVDLTPYIWVPSVNGSLQYDRASIRSGLLPSVPVIPAVGAPLGPPTSGTLNINVGPNSYLSKFNSGALFTVSARRGNGLLFSDFIYSNLSSTKNRIASFTGPFGNVNLQVSSGTGERVTGTIWTVGGGYALAQSKIATAYLFGGWRNAGVNTRLDWQFAGPFGILDRTGHAERNVSLNAALVGLRGQVRLGGHWYIPYYVDIGTGPSNSTWQGVGGIAYGNVALVFRNLQYNMPGDNLIQSLRFGGVALAGTFRL